MAGKVVAQALVALGVLSLFLALYQTNQYYTAQAAISPALSQLDQLQAAGGLEAAGISLSDLENTRSTISATTNAMMLTILADFVLGVIFLGAGLVAYPKEHKY